MPRNQQGAFSLNTSPTLRWFYSQWATNEEQPEPQSQSHAPRAIANRDNLHEQPNTSFQPKLRRCDVLGERGSELNQTKAAGLGGQPAERTCHQPIGHACVLHQQVYKYVSCFTLHVRGDGNPDGILNAAFHVVSFSRLVHPSLVRHLVPSQPVIGTLTLESKRSWCPCQSFSRSLHCSQLRKKSA